MVNTRTDVELSAAVQNALQTLLPQIRAEIREEFRTSSGPSNFGGNHPLVTIHTWLERFNKQKPRSFEKATAPVDAENWISHMEKIFDVMGCEDAFKTRLAVYKFEGNALAWWKAYKQAKAAGTAEEQAKNFQWGLRKSTLNHLMCMPFTDVVVLIRGVDVYSDFPIRAEIREEFRTGSGPSGSGGNPPPVTIHTWIERFNKQKPRSFEKATTPVDAEN
nr:hypothetical protein [Tanacetum cinerariifolium]